ncbi:hypothetical protein ACIP5N_33130 [Streptomyces sp. NPDC088768]|uniref:hypothetical protein n=1 Tax=Streptomyces sp. NPDC088768 TaxID=3365894 RepID=UPI0038190BC7
MSTTGAEAAVRTALHETLTSYRTTGNAAADHALPVYPCALAAHVVLRHDPHAVVFVIGEGNSPNWRSSRSVVGTDGTVRPLTDDNVAAWRPLCSRFDGRNGECHLDLVKACDAGTAQPTC